MAERSYSIENPTRGVYVVSWTGLLNGDTGVPFYTGQFQDRSVQLTGTLGVGGTCTIQGSLFTATPTYATLTDPQGNALTMTALGIEQILEAVNVIRPNVTAGDGSTSLTVKLLLTTTARR